MQLHHDDAVTQFLGAGQEAVTETGAFELVAHLLVGVGEQIFCVLIVRFSIDQLVQIFGGKPIVALGIEITAFRHHLWRRRPSFPRKAVQTLSGDSGTNVAGFRSPNPR